MKGILGSTLSGIGGSITGVFATSNYVEHAKQMQEWERKYQEMDFLGQDYFEYQKFAHPPALPKPRTCAACGVEEGQYHKPNCCELDGLDRLFEQREA